MLSGGNQQKVVVGPLAGFLKGKVYLFEEPTAGVDMGAPEEEVSGSSTWRCRPAR